MALGFNFGALKPGERKSAVMSGVNTKKKSNYIDFTGGQSDPNIDEYRRGLENKKIIRETRAKMNVRERANVLPDLTERERASAIMSGSGGRAAPMGKATMAMGGPDAGFLDFTEPSRGSRLNNPQQIKATAERAHSDARTDWFNQRQQGIASFDKTAADFEQGAQRVAKGQAGVRAVEQLNETQLRQARVRGSALSDSRDMNQMSRETERGWSGMEIKPETEEDRILADAASGMRADKLAAAAATRAKVQAFAQGGARMAGRAAGRVVGTADRYGREAAQAARGGLHEASTAMATAERQGRASFSAEQRMLSGMFMGGDGTFWNLPDSETDIRIHNDLHPSQRGDFGTADCFGFGYNGERSGMF